MDWAMKKTSQLLVGSIPLRSALDVFTTSSDYFGDNLAAMPDGEFGDRIWWHNYLARYAYHGHPDIKTIKRPAPVDGFPNWKPRDLSDMWLFELQNGVTSIKIDPRTWLRQVGGSELRNLLAFARRRKNSEIKKIPSRLAIDQQRHRDVLP
jgi:hypothetical protein